MSAEIWIPQAVTILVVLITGGLTLFQLRKQAQIQVETQRQQELWKAKYEAYVQALGVVNKLFYSLEWKDAPDDQGHQYSADPPTGAEYGEAYARLRLLTDDGALAKAFLASMGAAKGADGKLRRIYPTDFHSLIAVMRKDLGMKPDPTPETDFMIIEWRKPDAATVKPSPPMGSPSATPPLPPKRP